MTGDLIQFVSDNANELLQQNGVQSVGVGEDSDGNEVVVVGVENKNQLSSEEEDEIASFFSEDVPHEVREVGRFEAEVLKSQADPTGRFRPVIHGVSCGHPDVTAGTTGYLYETDDGTRYIGSNNHVLANVNAASVGDTQLQPGTADSGTVGEDDFGTLAYYKAVEDGVAVDLAIAGASASLDNSINDLNQNIAGHVESVSVGDTLVKSGRTTGVTTGTVDQVGTSVSVNYGDATYTISDCIITGDMSDGGDSGSATWLEQSDGLYAAGRLFAGSDTATVHHAYRNELAALQNEFDSSITLVTDGGGSGNPQAEVTLVMIKKQADMGDILATVEDDSQNRLSGATVSISGAASDSKTTGEQGVVTFSDMPIGEYSVTSVLDGYEDGSASVVAGDFE